MNTFFQGSSNSLDPIQSRQTNSGDGIDVGKILEALGAARDTVNKAIISFDFKKIPGATISKVDGGYQIGASFLPETRSVNAGVPSITMQELEMTMQNRVAHLMTTDSSLSHFTKTNAANDEGFALAA